MLTTDRQDKHDFGSPQMKAYDFMKMQNMEFPEEIAIEYLGLRISYRALFKKVEQFACALTANGIRQGDHVTVVLPNIPEIVYLFYACNRIGAITTLIDPRTNTKAILERANCSSAKALFILSDLIRKNKSDYTNTEIEKIVSITPADSLRDKTVPTIEANAVRFIYGCKRIGSVPKEVVSLKNFLLKAEGSVTDSEFTEKTACSIVYTSGTDGGKAKGVVLPNESYNSMPAMQMGGQRGFSRQNTFLACIPFFTAYGSVNGMHNSLCNGWTLQLIPKFKPADFDLLIKKYKPNHALGVPRFWESLVDSRRLRGTDLSFLILPTCGGDKITPISVERINRFLKERGSKANLIVGYGATEFGGAFSVTVADKNLYEPGSVGIFMEGVSGRIINPETGVEIKGNEAEGELCVKSPSMMLGYFKDDEETEKITWYDDKGTKYFRTGDKVRIDSKGLNWVIDRYKRVIIRPDGHTVSASFIENEMSKEACVQRCAVVGISFDGKAGAIPTAFIVMKDNLNCTEREAFLSIAANLNRSIPERDQPLAYISVDELPYTLMGKVDYRKLEHTKTDEVTVFWVNDPLTERYKTQVRSAVTR